MPHPPGVFRSVLPQHERYTNFPTSGPCHLEGFYFLCRSFFQICLSSVIVCYGCSPVFHMHLQALCSFVVEGQWEEVISFCTFLLFFEFSPSCLSCKTRAGVGWGHCIWFILCSSGDQGFYLKLSGGGGLYPAFWGDEVMIRCASLQHLFLSEKGPGKELN